jgi:hypothetical protein
MTALAQRRGKLGQPMEAVELAINVRNKTFHPPDKIKSVEWPSVDELVEAWLLATWYLELSILRLLEYRGNYTSRLEPLVWSGQTVPVPWK